MIALGPFRSLLLPALAVLSLAGAGARAEPPVLTLDDAVRLARARQPAIEAQQGQAAAAHGRQEQALARLLPFLDGSVAYAPTTPNFAVTPAQQRVLLANSGSAQVLDAAGAPVTVNCRTPGMGNCTPIPAPPNSWALQSYWTMQLGLNWTVWDWGRSIDGYRGARDLAAAADAGVAVSERDVVLNVQLAFFAAVTADEQVAVAEDAVKTYRAHTAQTRGLHDAGLRTGIDVATAESAEAAVAITLARARAARDAARAQLDVALGVDAWPGWTLRAPAATFELQPSDDARADAPLDALAESAAARRPEVVQLRLTESGLGAARAATRGSYLPQLTLSLGPSWAGTGLSSLTPNWSVVIGLGYPTGGMSPWLVHGQTREADGNLIGARAQQRATLEAIRAETVTARAALIAARDELRFARTLAEAAARQRGLADGRYQTGIGNVIELYDALLTDVNARFQLVQARLDLASARARLQHALGDRP
ncbi:MAG TPA: TolC family protein [Polyangia bacterium]|nr:TolC family protein [Polyangia bacterium]